MLKVINDKFSVVASSDWLGSEPIFYDERDGRTSHNINDLIDPVNFEFDPEGLYNYLDFSFSVFGRTPVRYIRFLEANCDLLRNNETGHISIRRRHDPTLDWVGKETKEADTWELLRSKIAELDDGQSDIIIPTSGGYDSRLLNYFWPRRSAIQSFTYGISNAQENSYEVIYAHQLAQVLGTHWKQIKLGDFHHYLDDWDALYGISTHAHGMYQMEFYNKLLTEIPARIVLSGIVGDAWAGNVPFVSIKKSSDITKLGYSHGVGADPNQLTVSYKANDREEFMLTNAELLNEKALQIVLVIRQKMLLLSYLLRVPQEMGCTTKTPFLDFEVAMSMVCLPPKRRLNRRWQTDFLSDVGLDLETKKLVADHHNTLIKTGIKRVPLPPLNADILAEVVNKTYVGWINNNIGQPTALAFNTLAPNRFKQVVKSVFIHTPSMLALLRNITRASDKQLKAISAYYTLRPIQLLLEQRRMASR